MTNALKEVKELKRLNNEITYSDTQGIAMALSFKYGLDEELILQYCNDIITLKEVFE